jgi:hypothetical protein
MEPNTKLLIEELMKEVHGEIQSLRKEMKDGFTEITAHEVAVNTRISELATAAEQREERVALLESTATEIDKMLTTWKPEVESSLSSIRLQLSKLNDYLERDNKPTDTSSPGTFTGGAASSHSSPGSTAAALMGTRVDKIHRDCGYGGVYTHTHDPVKGTVHTPIPPPQAPHALEFSAGRDTFRFSPMGDRQHKFPTGKLPKMHFPKFE